MTSIILKTNEAKTLQATGKVTISRVIKPPPGRKTFDAISCKDGWYWRHTRNNSVGSNEYFGTCPYGKPGSKRWVLESWATFTFLDNKKPSEIHQGIPQPKIWYIADDDNWDTRNPSAAPSNCMGKIRPSIFMPKWASRFTVEVKAVRIKQSKNWNIDLERVES